MSENTQKRLIGSISKLYQDALVTKQQLKMLAGHETEKIDFVSSRQYWNDIIKEIAVDEEDISICASFLAARYKSIVSEISALNGISFFDMAVTISTRGQSNSKRMEEALYSLKVKLGENRIKWHIIDVAAKTPSEAGRRFIVFVAHQFLRVLESQLNFYNVVDERCFEHQELNSRECYFYLNEVIDGASRCDDVIARSLESIEVSKIVCSGQGFIEMSGFIFGLTKINTDIDNGVFNAIHSAFHKLISGHSGDDFFAAIPISL